MNDYPPIRCYDDLIDCFRRRKDELGLTMETLDRLTQLAPGYCAKVLGDAQVKKLGKDSFDEFMQALALQLHPAPDLAFAQKMERRWEENQRERPLGGEHARVSMRALNRFTPIVVRIRNAAIAPKGGKARAAKLSAKRRTQIARKAARARWRRGRTGS